MIKKTTLLMGLALAISATVPATAQQKPLVPVEAFTKQDQFSSPRLSPDGKHIAIKVRIMRNKRMIPTLTVYSLPDLKIVSVLAMDTFDIPLNYTWLTNTRLVVTKGIEIGLRERPWATGEVVSVDLDGKRQQYLFGYDNFKSSSKGDRYGDDYGWADIESIPKRNGHVQLGTHLWRSKRSFLYDVDSSSATRKLITEIGGEDLDFHTQRDGTPRFASGVDEASEWITYRRDDNNEWKKLDREVTGKRFIPLLFTKDNNEFFALRSTKGEPTALVRESFKTGERTILAQDKRSTLSLEWNENDSSPFAVVTNVGIPSVRYIEPDSGNTKLHKSLSLQFPGSVVHFIDFTDDGSKLLFSVASDRDPGSYYLYDKVAGKADLLFTVLEDIDPDQMAERRPFAYKARDGLELFGYLTVPKADLNDKSKLPMVVIPHGGPFGPADDWYFDSDAQFLASRGYAVLQVNFRGSGNRGEAFKESGYKQWGGKIQDDIIDGVKAAIEQGGIDANRICTFGASFGGYSALMLTVKEPAMFKCAIGYAGRYYLPATFNQHNVASSKRVKTGYARSMGDNEEELIRQSPSRHADKIKVPVWLIHGGKDEVVLPEQAKIMREALIKAGNPPEWTYEPDEGHGFYDAQRRKELYEKLEGFLAKHIGKPH